MPIKIALSIAPVVAAAVLVNLFAALNASPQLAVAAVALVATLLGAAVGVFWPVSSEPPKWSRNSRGYSSRQS